MIKTSLRPTGPIRRADFAPLNGLVRSAVADFAPLNGLVRSAVADFAPLNGLVRQYSLHRRELLRLTESPAILS